jgi:hypothetical protein
MNSIKTAMLAGLIALVLIVLTQACGYSSKATTPPTAGTMPTIEALSPNSANHGGAAFVLTVNGSNFNSNAVVNWNGTAQTTSYVTGDQLTASIPASAIASAGTVQVTVTNPGTAGGLYGGGTSAETSSEMTFTIN